MTVLDWGLLIVWLGVTLSGFWEGAVRVVFGGGGLILGVWLAIIAGAEATAALEGLIGIEWLAALVARLLLATGCLLLCLLAGWGIERTLKALHLGWLNRLCGAGLAAVVGALLLALLLVTASRLSPSWNRWCAESVVAPRLAGLLGWAVETQQAARDDSSSSSDEEAADSNER
jgi:uncharacterized membrane protein required for colicin V production